MNSSTELELRANGNSVMVVDHAGDLLFDAISNIRSALKKAGIEIKNIPRLGYVMNLASDRPAQIETTQVLIEDNNESNIVLVHDDERHDEPQVTTVDMKPSVLSFLKKWQFKPSIQSLMSVFLLSTAVIFIISMLAAYLYEASPTVCVPEQDRIVCTSDDPDFHFSNMSIEFDIESFIHHTFEES